MYVVMMVNYKVKTESFLQLEISEYIIILQIIGGRGNDNS